MLTYSTATSDMTSPATSGQHVLKFEFFRKMAKNAAADGFGSNFSIAAFCLAKPIGWLLVIITNIYMLYIYHKKISNVQIHRPK